MSQMVAGIVPVSLEFTDANTVVTSQHVSQPYFKMDSDIAQSKHSREFGRI